MKEGGDMAAVGGRVTQSTPGGPVPELLCGHVTMTDGTQCTQVVHVTRSTAVSHGHNVIHVPELRPTNTHTSLT